MILIPALVCLFVLAEIGQIFSVLESSPKKRPGKLESVKVDERSSFRLESWKCNEVIDSQSVVFDLRGDEGRMRNLIEVHVVHNLPVSLSLFLNVFFTKIFSIFKNIFLIMSL